MKWGRRREVEGTAPERMMQAHRFPKIARRDSARAASAGCRRGGSSYSSAVFPGPAGGQRGGDQRQQQLVVASDGVAARFRSAAAMGRRGGTPHYILHRTVVLNKVEVRGSNGAKRNAEITNDGNGFKKNFGEENGGAPIEIHAAGMHPLDEGAEEPEIEMRGGAQGGAVGGAVHVRNVRADGQVNRHRNAVFVSSNEDAGFGVFDFHDVTREKLAGGFAIADADALGKFSDFVKIFSGLFGHAELARAETGFDVFGSVAGERDLEVVDQRRTVHGDSGDETSLHQIDQDGTETDFDDVAADAPENGSALYARAVDGGEEMAEIIGGEDLWKGVEEFCERGIRGGSLRKVAEVDFALPRGERVSMNCAEGDGMNGIDAHGKGFTLRRSPPQRKKRRGRAKARR